MTPVTFDSDVVEHRLAPGDEDRWWLTADPHFGHANIILPAYCDRPFADCDEMNGRMFASINERVAPDDVLVIVGDFAFGQESKVVTYRDRICCRDVRLVIGNHDLRWLKTYRRLGFFSSICGTMKLQGDDWMAFLHHWPLEDDWPLANPGAFLVHGHRHGNAPARPWRIDVGVDVQGFVPVRLSDVVREMKGRVSGS